MKLSTYLEESAIPVAEFAQNIGVSRVSVYRYCSGAAIPERDVMVAIYKNTGGKVTPNDLYDLPRLRKRG